MIMKRRIRIVVDTNIWISYIIGKRIKDDFIINLAIDGKADYIITGDKDLLEIGNYRAIDIIRLHDFMIMQNK